MIEVAARDVGTAFVKALSARDFTAARALLAGDVRFRMLLPSGLQTEADAHGVIARFSGWFGDADRFEVEGSDAHEVEGRAAVVYRFRVHDADGWQAIEQHLMIDVDPDGRIAGIDLLCSGFRSIAMCEPERVHRFDAGEMGCADGLAGEFRRQMHEIPVGDVLVVSTRDPAAKEDLPPLARMMGHVVRSVEVPGDGRLLVSVERGR
jgi:TusA-related sulfurtransferase